MDESSGAQDKSLFELSVDFCGEDMRIDTFAALARKLGTTMQDMCSMTAGDLDAEQVQTFARALGVSVDELQADICFNTGK